MYKKGHTSLDIKYYLVPKYSRPSQLKSNTKLHKKVNSLRTIVNGISTPTEKMAQFAVKELNEYSTKSPIYIYTIYTHSIGERQTANKSNLIFFFTLWNYILQIYIEQKKKVSTQFIFP